MNIDTLSALAQPNRFQIVELLKSGPRSVNEVAQQTKLRQPQASKHLNILQQAGIVVSQPVAQQRIYMLKQDRFQEIDQWLKSFEGSWDKRLSKLDSYLNKLKERS